MTFYHSDGTVLGFLENEYHNLHLVVNSAAGAGQLIVDVPSLVVNGPVNVASLTCTGTPCGSGGGTGGGPNLTAQTLVLSGPTLSGSGNYDLKITDSSPYQAYIGNTNAGSYAVLWFGNDANQQWQFALGGSATDASLANNWYLFDNGIGGTAGAGSVMLAHHGTGDLTIYNNLMANKTLAVSSAGLPCATGVLFCVGGTTRTAAPFKVDSAGNATVASLTCTGTPCGAATTRPAPPTSLTASVMTARRNCKGHGAGEIWADDRYIYHCKANGSGYNEATLGRTP
jgi:hypothetical protein